MACDCSKPKPGPNGNQKPAPTSLIASTHKPVHVAPNGVRTEFNDLLGATAAAARQGGRVEP